MDKYFSEEILNIGTEFKEENYNQLFRRKSNIEIKEQNNQFFRRKSNIKSNQLSIIQVSKNYNQLFRRKSNIEIKEQNNQFFRRKSNIKSNQLSTIQVSKQDEITKRQIEELVHNKVGKFVKETFQNQSTQTNFESIEQHKYARLSKGSYRTYRGENKELDEMLKGFTETENFVVDTQLTNANATIFHNVKTGETVIAINRGIDPGSLNINEIEKTKLPNFSDRKTDGAILIGQEAKTARFLEAEKTFQKTVNKYGKESINLTGHSLGSGQSLYIGEKFDVPSCNFNGTVSVNQALEDINNIYLSNKQLLYRTHLDPVSVDSLLTSKHSNRKVININTHLGKANTILETHDIDHFISEGAEIEGGVVKVSKASKMATF
jgi:predicted esterase YcpF (UPF0227 family)